jgi:hypothetical protein
MLYSTSRPEVKKKMKKHQENCGEQKAYEGDNASGDHFHEL